MANITAIPTFPTNSTNIASDNAAVAEAIRACMALLATLPSDVQRQQALKQFLLARPIQERTLLQQADPVNGLIAAKAQYETESAQKRQSHDTEMAAKKEAKKREDEAKAAAAAAATAVASAASPAKEKSKKSKKQKAKERVQRAATPDSSSDSSDSSSSDDSE